MEAYKTIHPCFKLNGISFTKDTLLNFAFDYAASSKEFEKHIGSFLLNWFDAYSHVKVQTSGTTGTPKIILIEKKAMVNSALATGLFFELNAGNTTLLCMSAQYIAGKMMLVRALVLGLELDVIAPSSNPLAEKNKEYDFVAMVPLQVENAIEKLYLVKKLIIGGAALNTTLRNNLIGLSTEIYETYGMTETVTHIAAKKISETDFSILPNISISIDDRECLVIKAPKLTTETLVTNDIVALTSLNTFKWIGRYDNVINSGGVKLFPEQIEEKLQDKIKKRFFITAENDDKLGQKVVLIIEGKPNLMPSNLFDTLSKFEKPKKVLFVPKFIETETNKINRKGTLLAIQSVGG